MVLNADTEVQQARVRVVNIGGPLDNFVTPRSQRSDFRHVDLNRGPNTITNEYLSQQDANTKEA